jgi:hypothetical protein
MRNDDGLTICPHALIYIHTHMRGKQPLPLNIKNNHKDDLT